MLPEDKEYEYTKVRNAIRKNVFIFGEFKLVLSMNAIIILEWKQ